MERGGILRSLARKFVWKLGYFLRKCIFSVVSVGQIPSHIAFIMDGNRRYGKQQNLKEGAGHDAGWLALAYMLICCCELKIKYITAYTFSIDNFKRKPEEVQYIMDLTLKTIQAELSKRSNSIFSRYGIRVHFAGNLELLSDTLKDAAERLMAETGDNSNALLTICFAYTSTDEMVNAIRKTCLGRIDQGSVNVEFAEIEKHMYMAVAPYPDVIIRTSGERRLSNFLLWQSTNSCLIFFSRLWPGITVWHLVWAVLEFQRNHRYYMEKKKEQLCEC